MRRWLPTFADIRRTCGSVQVCPERRWIAHHDGSQVSPPPGVRRDKEAGPAPLTTAARPSSAPAGTRRCSNFRVVEGVRIQRTACRTAADEVIQ